MDRRFFAISIILALIIVGSRPVNSQTSEIDNNFSELESDYQYTFQNIWTLEYVNDFKVKSLMEINYDVAIIGIAKELFHLRIDAEFTNRASQMIFENGTVIEPILIGYQVFGEDTNPENGEYISVPSFGWIEEVSKPTLQNNYDLSNTFFGPSYSYGDGVLFIQTLFFNRFINNNFIILPLDTELQVGDSLKFGEPLYYNYPTKVFEYIVQEEFTDDEKNYWKLRFDFENEDIEGTKHEISGTIDILKDSGLITDIEMKIKSSNYDNTVISSGDVYFYQGEPDPLDLSENTDTNSTSITITGMIVILLVGIRKSRVKLKEMAI